MAYGGGILGCKPDDGDNGLFICCGGNGGGCGEILPLPMMPPLPPAPAFVGNIGIFCPLIKYGGGVGVKGGCCCCC